MNKVPHWALWGVVGAVGGLLVGYLLYGVSDPPRVQTSREEMLLWIVIGAVVGTLLSLLLTSRAPPSNPT